MLSVPSAAGVGADPGQPSPHCDDEVFAVGGPQIYNKEGWATDEEEEEEAPARHEEASARSLGADASVEEDWRSGGIWHAVVVSDKYNDPKNCTAAGKLKPRRPVPYITVSGLAANLKKGNDGIWLLSAALNEWPALVDLELRALTVKVKAFGGVGLSMIKRLWDARSPKEGPLRSLEKLKGKMPSSLRATFRAPSWTAQSWSPGCPGFCFWFAPNYTGGPRFFHGEGMIHGAAQSELSSAKALRAHLFVHRYAKDTESIRDKLTWHGAVLLEWSHQLFASVVELAFWNGCTGYSGRSNWCKDARTKGRTRMDAVVPDAMKAPWQEDVAEIRFIDMEAPCKNIADFKEWLRVYSEAGKEQRFFDPKVVHSDDVRLSNQSLLDILRYLLNYINRYAPYNELRRNCQTFAADFFMFLTGQTGVVPYQTFLWPMYKARTSNFLYSSRPGAHSAEMISKPADIAGSRPVRAKTSPDPVVQRI